MEGKEIIKNSKKLSNSIKAFYIIGILLILVACIAINYIETNKKTEAQDFATGMGTELEEGTYAYLDIDTVTTEVAIYGNTENDQDINNDRYYIATSGKFMYIIDLNFETINQLKEIQEYTYSEDENAVQPEPARIYGITEKIPDELKQLVVDYYNDSVEDEYKMTIDEFSGYYGTVLLNARKSPVDTTAWSVAIVLGLIFLIVAICTHFTVFITKLKYNKYFKKNGYLEEIESELNDNVIEKHYHDKVILTKNYLIDTQLGLFAVRYSDIKWLYIHTTKMYGFIPLSTNITVCLKDGKTSFSLISTQRKKDEEFMKVFDKVCEMVPQDTLKGYTPENIESYKEYKKGKNKEKNNKI